MSKPKIAFIGAGSYGFTYKLVADILSFDALKESKFVFMDVDKERLDNLKILLDAHFKKINYNYKPIYTLKLEKALEGANFVINLVKIGFLAASEMDMDIAKKYGLYQTIGDTCGLGGVFRGLRTMIFNNKMFNIMEKVSAPDAIVLNYTNPQSILVIAAAATTKIPFIGLCHSVQGTTHQLAKILNVPYDELDYEAAGINHMSWITRLETKGKDLYPKLREMIKEKGVFFDSNNEDNIFAGLGPTRLDMFNRVGYMVTESSIHFPEYVPFYLKDKEIREKYRIPIDRYKINISRKEKQYAEKVEAAKNGTLDDHTPSVEYGSKIINSMITNIPCKIYANVMNKGLITNLPQDCAVEVACMVDRNGVQPCHYGKLPPQLAAMCNMNINVHKLTVEAILKKDRRYVYWALMMDPLTHSVLNLDQIETVVDELIDRQQEYLGEYL